MDKILWFLFTCTLIIPGIWTSKSLNNNDDSSRIIGGDKVTNRNQYPFMVSLHVPLNRRGVKIVDHYCGGTILNKRWILTAAHCGPHPEDPYILVVAGVVDLKTNDDHVQKIRVKDTFIHPNYSRQARVADVALMYLEEDLHFSDYIQSIQLAQNPETYPSGDVQFMGWGIHNDTGVISLPKTLRAVNGSIREYETCAGAKPSGKGMEICVGVVNKTACKGDSGGPLIQTTDVGVQQIGIASFASLLCDGDVVYTYVGSYYESFIKPTMDNYQENGINEINKTFEKKISYIVPIYKTSNTSSLKTKICSGTIIWNNWILTAAHCVDFDDQHELFVLNKIIDNVDQDHWSNENAILVKEVHFHSHYESQNDVHSNLAMLKLTEPLTLGVTLKPLLLPQRDVEISNYLKTAGYQEKENHTSSNDHFESASYDVNLIKFEECDKNISPNGQHLREEKTICVLSDSRSDPNCDLDIGGPLYDEDENIFGVAIRRTCGYRIDSYEKIIETENLVFIIETMRSK